jgi:hypothetical protein
MISDFLMNAATASPLSDVSRKVLRVQVITLVWMGVEALVRKRVMFQGCKFPFSITNVIMKATLGSRPSTRCNAQSVPRKTLTQQPTAQSAALLSIPTWSFRLP